MLECWVSPDAEFKPSKRSLQLKRCACEAFENPEKATETMAGYSLSRKYRWYRLANPRIRSGRQHSDQPALAEFGTEPSGAISIRAGFAQIGTTNFKLTFWGCVYWEITTLLANHNPKRK